MFNTLRETVGNENVSQKDADKLAYSSDASRIRGKADTIIWPKNLEDVRQAIAYAKRHNINLVPRGAGTGLAGGAVPQNSVVLDLCKMNRFGIKDDKALAEPGVVLDDLNSASEYILPVVPGSHSVCTIGGMIATNSAGMRGFKYGKMINWVEELHVIDGTGKLMKIKGDKIKNFCGMEGTTGVVVRARLKLIKLPEQRSISLLSFESITHLVEKLRSLKKDNVLALEYIDKYCSNLVGLGDSNHLMIEYEGDEGEFKGEKAQELWKKREELYTSVTSRGYSVVEDPQIPLESIDKFLYWLQKSEIPTYGHIGIGIVHPHFRDNKSKLIEEMFTVVKKLKGNVSGEHGIGLLKKSYLDAEFLNDFKKIKEVYDPNNVLNKGKIL